MRVSASQIGAGFVLLHDIVGDYLPLYSVSCNIEAMRTRVTKRGQVSVPSDVRRRLQIGPETVLEWVVEGTTARVIPVPADPVRAFRGSGPKGQTAKLTRERRRDSQRERG